MDSGNLANQNQIHYNSLSQDDNYDKSDHSTRSRKQTIKIKDNQSIQNSQQSNQICQIYLSSTLNQAPISPPIRSMNALNQVNHMNNSPPI